MNKIRKLPKRPMVEKGWGGIDYNGKCIGEIFVYHEADSAEAYLKGNERFGTNIIKKELGGGSKKVETVKILAVKNGKAGSLHFHLEKEEIFFVLSGCFEIITISDGKEVSLTLDRYDTILLPPGAVHQIIGRGEENILIEISTLDKSEDSIKIRKGD